jgi:hypothetical protein
MVFCLQVTAANIRGRVDSVNQYGYYPFANAYVEVWLQSPNGPIKLAETSTDQWGFYYFSFPPGFQGNCEIWVNRRVYQSVYIHPNRLNDITPILFR